MRTFAKLMPLLALAAALLSGCGDYEERKVLDAKNKELVAQLDKQKAARLAELERLDSKLNMFMACHQWVDVCTKKMVVDAEEAFAAGGRQNINLFWLFWVKLAALGGLVGVAVGCAIGAARVWFARAEMPSQSDIDAARQEIASARGTADAIIKTAQQVAYAESETAKREAVEARELVAQVKARQSELRKLDLSLKTAKTELEAITAVLKEKTAITDIAKGFKI